MFARLGEKEASQLFRWLWTDFIENHCQIRFTSLLLMDALFTRSHICRLELMKNLETFMKLSIGIKRHPLPPPEKYHQDLKTTALKCLHRWYLFFGNQSREVRKIIVLRRF